MMNWGKSCGETTSPELHWYLAARNSQTFGERGVFWSWCCSGCGASVARKASCCCWLCQRRKKGQKYPGTCQFYDSHSGKCQFYNNHSGKAGKCSDSVNNSLDMHLIFFLLEAGSCQVLCWLLLCIPGCSPQWLFIPVNHSLLYFSAWPGWSNLWLVQWFKLKYHLAAI